MSSSCRIDHFKEINAIRDLAVFSGAQEYMDTLLVVARAAYLRLEK